MNEPPPTIRPQTAPNDREKIEIEVISKSGLRMQANQNRDTDLSNPGLLITSYFNIIKRMIIDVVPKSISYSLVTYSKDNIQKELLKELYKPDVLDDLLQESEHVVTRRKEVRAMLGALTKAEE